MTTAQVEITNVTSFDFYVLKTKEQKELKELIDRLVAKYRRSKPFTEPKEAEPPNTICFAQRKMAIKFSQCPLIKTRIFNFSEIIKN